jgi:type II secretory ATPase GspE/PulE/Tfp pilus assembly ATPase PilB-like protein
MQSMRAVAVRSGFLSLYQEGLAHVLAGNTSFEEIACLSYTAAP